MTKCRTYHHPIVQSLHTSSWRRESKLLIRRRIHLYVMSISLSVGVTLPPPVGVSVHESLCLPSDGTLLRGRCIGAKFTVCLSFAFTFRNLLRPVPISESSIAGKILCRAVEYLLATVADCTIFGFELLHRGGEQFPYPLGRVHSVGQGRVDRFVLFALLSVRRSCGGRT